MTEQPSRVTFKSPDIWFGEFRLPVGHPGWNIVNTISDGCALIAFPGPAVQIHQYGHQPIVADPMRAVLYSPGAAYRRAVVAPQGDRCSYMAFDPALAAEAAVGFDRAAHDKAGYRFPFAAASLASSDVVLKQHVRSRIGDASADPGEIRERLYWLLDRTVASGYGDVALRGTVRRPTTVREHADLVESVRRLIGLDPSARDSLDDLAAAVNSSPYHLSRVFRHETGMSVHGYRTQVRLRESLERIADGDRLADIALDLGFASQAHLTDRFGRAYGVTPDVWRRTIHAGRQTSTNVKERRRRAA